MHLSGCAVFDVNCFKHLENKTTFERVKASLRAVDLDIWVTAANCLEAATTPNPAIRARLLTVAREATDGRPLIPDPHELLKQNAKAAQLGQSGFRCEPSGLEWMLDPSAVIDDKLVKKARTLIEESDAYLEKAHDAGRAKVQKLLKAPGPPVPWSSARDFLDNQWMKVGQLDVFIDTAWQALGLGYPPAPYDILLANPAWRLYLEGIGVSIYRGTIAAKRGRRVQQSDLQQLIYLAGRDRRVLISEDEPFIEAANDVLTGRHTLARALRWSDFLRLT